MPKKVRAVREGYYGRRRRPGVYPECVFDIGDDEKPGSWMEVIDDGAMAPEKITAMADQQESEVLPPQELDTMDGATVPLDDNLVPTHPAGSLEANIIEALLLVDHDDDDCWNSDGTVAVETVAELVGNVDVATDDIQRAWPGFCRQ